MSWTEEKIEQLAKLWNEGLTTGEIGRIIGMSKNAVVGKAHRLGLEGRPSPIKRDVNPKTKKKTKALDTDTSKKSDAPKTKLKTKEDLIGLTDLTMHSCRWPIGDPKDKDFHFCGKEAIAGKPYCGEHVMVAYVGINKH